jgi:two-component system phosphate regulon sensor histidine kinase PhoR
MAGATVRAAEGLRRGTASVRQALLLALVALDAAPNAAVEGTFGPFWVGGLVLLLVATGWTVLSGRRPDLPAAVPVIMAVDLAAVGLMRLVPAGNGVGFLAVLIALWLGMDLRGRGVVLSLLGTLSLVVLPSLLYFGIESASLSRGLLLPVTAVVCSVTTAGATRVWAEQNRELEDRGHRLRHALDAVVANRALNDAIVATVDVGLVALNRSGAYRTMNPQHTTFMELAFPDGHGGVAGQDGYVYAADRLTPLSRDEMPSMRAMRGEEFEDYVIWVGRDPARQRALSVSARPVVDDKGDFDGAVLAYMDITELMSALKVKDEFVASVSHELRTPLTVVMGYLDLVLGGARVDPGVQQQLQIVRRNSERLLRMVDDLLLTARFEQGQLIVDLGDTDLAGLVTEALADLEPRARAAGVTLESWLPGPVVVGADQVRMRQVVDNLVSNAIKYTPSGGTVRVLLEPREDLVDLVVADTGIGISAEDRPRLFTKFFRSAEAEAMAIPGIGLGLAITNAVVEAHRGSILVDSEPGRGSTFRVRLPLRALFEVVSPDPGRDAATFPLPVGPTRA